MVNEVIERHGWRGQDWGVTLWQAWERRAEMWTAWARKPGHDGFWDGTWPELRAVLPQRACTALDVGCGEGRSARALARLGHRVVAVERSGSLASAARHHDEPIAVVNADAGRLPVPTSSVDLVVGCMLLIDVDDLDAVVSEMARVLRVGGHACVALVHPLASAALVTEPDVAGGGASYLDERRYQDRRERDGMVMTFESVHRPLGRYLTVFLEAGLAVDGVREFGENPIPWLLVMRFKRATGA
jgi:SAM-dependent methyltransferase